MTTSRPDIQLWAYPEEINLAGPERLATLASELGARALSVALTYHQCVRVLPRYQVILPGTPGGVHFTPTRRLYETLFPVERPRSVGTSAIAALRAACSDLGVEFRAWIVALDNELLAVTDSYYAAQTLDGTPTVHALCPSHPEVRGYVSALVTDIMDQFAPQLVELEAALYPGWNGYLAEISLEELDPRARLYGAQCLCEACRSSLAKAGIDAREARAAFLALAAPGLGDSPSSGALGEYAEVAHAVNAVRDSGIAELMHEVSAAIANRARLRLTGFGDPGGLEVRGLGPRASAAAGDVLVGVGTASGADLRAQLAAHVSAPYAGPSAVGLTWAPGRTGAELGEDARSALRLGINGLSFYNLSLVPDDGIGSLREAILLASQASQR